MIITATTRRCRTRATNVTRGLLSETRSNENRCIRRQLPSLSIFLPAREASEVGGFVSSQCASVVCVFKRFWKGKRFPKFMFVFDSHSQCFSRRLNRPKRSLKFFQRSHKISGLWSRNSNFRLQASNFFDSGSRTIRSIKTQNLGITCITRLPNKLCPLNGNPNFRPRLYHQIFGSNHPKLLGHRLHSPAQYTVATHSMTTIKIH